MKVLKLSSSADEIGNRLTQGNGRACSLLLRVGVLLSHSRFQMLTARSILEVMDDHDIVGDYSVEIYEKACFKSATYFIAILVALFEKRITTAELKEALESTKSGGYPQAVFDLHQKIGHTADTPMLKFLVDLREKEEEYNKRSEGILDALGIKDPDKDDSGDIQSRAE